MRRRLLLLMLGVKRSVQQKRSITDIVLTLSAASFKRDFEKLIMKIIETQETMEPRGEDSRSPRLRGIMLSKPGRELGLKLIYITTQEGGDPERFAEGKGGEDLADVVLGAGVLVGDEFLGDRLEVIRRVQSVGRGQGSGWRARQKQTRMPTKR